jgi:hypothetical protein
MKCLRNMRRISVKSVRDLSLFENQIEIFEQLNVKNKKDKKNDENCHCESAFEEVTKQIRLFDQIASGMEENIEDIKKVILDDPKRTEFDISKKELYYINQTNFEGLTPLFVACQNGHLNIAQLLLKYNADHLIKCGVS